FTCEPERSGAYWRARGSRPGRHEIFTLATFTDTLTPNFNRPVRVPTALSPDLTSLVPTSRLLRPGTGCAQPDSLVGQLRAAGVSHLLTVDHLETDLLPLVAEVS